MINELDKILSDETIECEMGLVYSKMRSEMKRNKIPSTPLTQHYRGSGLDLSFDEYRGHYINYVRKQIAE